MIDFSSGLSHLFQQGLSEVSIDSRYGINYWLTEGKEYFAIQDQLSNEFTISSFDLNDFLKPYAHDINRLSCAAMESLNDISVDDITPKFFGWILTKYYYSAFFSAHSILRITGNCLSNINSQSTDRVRKLTRTRGYADGNLSAGTFSIFINRGNNTYRFLKEGQYADSHKGLWLRFLDFLKSSKNGIYSQMIQADAQLIVDKIDELIMALTNYSLHNGSWLSVIRNKVNYSHDYGVWFPYKGFTKELNDIIRCQSVCKENPLTIDLNLYRGKDLIYFVRTCQLINSINFNLQVNMLSKNSANKSFLLQGIFEYQNKYIKKSIHNNGFVNL